MGCSQGKTSSPASKSTAQTLLGSQDVQKVSAHNECRLGHALHKYVAPQEGCKCDECNNLMKHEVVLSCNECNFIKCKQCFNRPDEWEQIGRKWETLNRAKTQQIVGAETGVETEIQPIARGADNENALIAGARVSAITDIKYSDDQCIPEGSVGTVTSVLHKTVWINWDGLAPLDNAVVLASQVELLDERARRIKEEDQKDAAVDDKNMNSTRFPVFGSPSAPQVSAPQRAPSPALFPSAASLATPHSKSVSSHVMSCRAAGLATPPEQPDVAKAALEETPKVSSYGMSTEEKLRAEASRDVAMKLLSPERKLQDKSARKDKSNLCCC